MEMDFEKLRPTRVLAAQNPINLNRGHTIVSVAYRKHAEMFQKQSFGVSAALFTIASFKSP